MERLSTGIRQQRLGCDRRSLFDCDRFLLIVSFLISFCGTLTAQVVDEVGGIAVFEAEAFNANISRSSHTWTLDNSVPGSSGNGYMEALPNNGTTISAAQAPFLSPELQFTLNFTVAGNHYYWLRLYSNNGNDNSVHLGTSGTGVNTLSAAQFLTWAWIRSAAVSIPGTGNHTINVWMAEDGIRVDRLLVTNNLNFSPTIGNAWHVPSSPEATGGVTMRNPLTVYPGVAVTIFDGNQYQGAGTVGNQLETGSAIFYRKTSDNAWSSAAMTFSSQSGNNKYYSGSIPASAFSGGDTIHYYLKIPYTDHLPTFLYGTDTVSQATEFEADAQNSPFVFIVRPLQLSIARETNGFSLSWPSQTGLVYRVEWKGALNDSIWQAITPDFPGTGSTLRWVDDGSQTGGVPTKRFYRLIVL